KIEEIPEVLEEIKKIETVNIIEEEENIEPEISKEYIVENLSIPLYLEGTTLNSSIEETEVRNRQKRLVEFREERYPSYKIDDFSDFNHYKALDITIPFENRELPERKLDKKIFAGKVDIHCNKQIIYGVSIKSNMSGQLQVIEFKNHDFTLKLLLKNSDVINYSYKISENTNNIKGKNVYIFFKNLFSGFELNFKNKKITGHFKITEKDLASKIEIIIDMIDKYSVIKKKNKIKSISLKDLLKNTRSLDVLYSYYNNTSKVSQCNITIRGYLTENSSKIDKLSLSYPISVNFLGVKKSLIETTNIDLEPSNIKHVDDRLEVQAFSTVQTITYKEI
ncbi:MAG: hypothetical protein KAH04_06505, partial [Psychrilyobacter sp.]|nr:hypothetical protein [Psychrilyobacter sp.]